MPYLLYTLNCNKEFLSISAKIYFNLQVSKKIKASTVYLKRETRLKNMLHWTGIDTEEVHKGNEPFS